MGPKNHLRNILRWSETYMKTDMVYATQGGFWLLITKGVGIATSLFLATAMANLVPVAAFGIYKFVIAGASIIGGITLINAAPAITRSVAQGFDGSLSVTALAYLKWSLITIAISFGVAMYYYINGNNILALSFLIGGLLTPIINTTALYSHFLAGKKDFRVFSVFESIRTIAPSMILIVTVFLTDSPVLILLSYFTSTALVTFLLFYTTLRKYCSNTKSDPATVPYARQLGLMGFIGKLPEHLDKILVFHFLGAVQLAVYAFALTPISHLKLLNDIPSRLMLPKLPTRDLSVLQSTLPRKILLVVLAMAVIVFAYVLVAPYIFRILFPLYMDAVLYSQVFACSLLLAPGSIFAEALTAHMKIKELYISQISLPIIKIALLAVLLPFFGIWGAIAAILLSQLVAFGLYAWLFFQAKS